MLALCLRLGYPSVRHFRRGTREGPITGREETLWIAYYQIDPFDDTRGDEQTALLASIFANANRDPSKGDPFKLEDFMPDHGRHHRLQVLAEGETRGVSDDGVSEMTREEGIAWMKAFAQSHGGGPRGAGS